jgi:hypothetical protein
MTSLSDDNIVVRTLLNVLDPSAEQLDACARKRHVALTRCRSNTRISAAEACYRAVKRPAQIVVTEWLSSATISVSWSDSCTGRYIEQIWCSGLSRATSICVLTGRTIRRGDRVFRPRTRGVRVPANEDQMILVEAIEHPTDLPVS